MALASPACNTAQEAAQPVRGDEHAGRQGPEAADVKGAAACVAAEVTALQEGSCLYGMVEHVVSIWV